MGTMIKSSGLPIVSGSEDVVLFYQDWGQGKPIVLIHGWPLNSDMWEYQARGLAEQGFRVIAYDRRGFGRSSKPFQGYNYDTLAGDLSDLMVQLDLRDATLVAFSMGGGEIARYLSRFGSARVEKTILVSSVVPYLLEGKDNPDGVNAKVFDDMQAALKDDRPKFISGFAKDFYGVGLLSSPVSDEMLDWTFNLALQGSPKATLECVTAFSRTDFRADLKSFTMPTLLIHGSADKVVPILPTSEAAVNLIPGATLKTYDGAPHGLFITHKEELLEDIMLFASSQRHLEHVAGRGDARLESTLRNQGYFTPNQL